MNVYIIEMIGGCGSYSDCYDSHMVAADSEEEAREACEVGEEAAHTWTDEKLSTCRLVEKGDIVSSFNAG